VRRRGGKPRGPFKDWQAANANDRSATRADHMTRGVYAA